MQGSFCKLALRIHGINGLGEVITRDQSHNGAGCVINEENFGAYESFPIVDFDCMLIFPDGWTGPRQERVRSGQVDGRCGRDPREPQERSAALGGGLVAVGALGLISSGWMWRRERATASVSIGAD